MRRSCNIRRKSADGHIHGRTCLLILGLVIVLIGAGCATTVSLRATEEARLAFANVDIDPDKYAFFTTGPDQAPEAVLIIENAYLGDFDSSGWKLRQKKAMMDMLEMIRTKASEARKFGYPVLDDKGEKKGMMYTTFRHGKVFIDEEEGTFSVATPSMMDTGKGTYKRTTCTISICQ